MLKLISFVLFFGIGARAETRWLYESYLSSGQEGFANSKINPDNQVLRLSQNISQWDNRFELKYSLDDSKIILRPRWTLTKDSFTTRGKVDLTDGFWEQTWSPQWASTVGLQVYQWGPAEIFNPSNPFFRLNLNQQSVTFKEKGKALARLNWSLNSENSIVLILEPVSNNERYWLAEKDFKPAAGLKYERNWSGTRNYVGLIGGVEVQNNRYFGEYGQYEFSDGLSIYVDAKHSQSLPSYGPVDSPFGYNMTLTGEDSSHWAHLGVAGLRYEGDFDVRVEYLYNGDGYDKTTWDHALSSASNLLNPLFAQNLNRFLNSGLTLLTKNYLYLSYRVADPLSHKDLNLYARTLTSLTDQSGLIQGEFDKAFHGAWMYFASYTNYFGKENSEFKLLDNWKFFAGLKFTE